MKNPLVDDIQALLDRYHLGAAKLVRESFSEQAFGNAEAVYELGSVRLLFHRDRGQDIVSIGDRGDPPQLYLMDDVAVWMDWLSLDDLLRYDAAIDFDKPPEGPIFGLSETVRLIAKDFRQIDRAFAPRELDATRAALAETQRERIAAT